MNARAGHRWYASRHGLFPPHNIDMYCRNRFNSDKVAEVSYASEYIGSTLGIDAHCFDLAIQGRDCLIQKFRNSSVMLEHPSFRPKVSGSEKYSAA